MPPNWLPRIEAEHEQEEDTVITTDLRLNGSA